MVAIQTSSITIDNREYEVRRLNVKDTFVVARLLGIAISRAETTIDRNSTAEDIGTLLIAALPFMEGEALKFCGSLIGVSAEEFGDFPPEALVDLFEILSESQDLKSFLARCAKVFKMQQLVTK